MTEPGYEGTILAAFIREHATEYHEDGRLWELNEIRVTDSNRDTLARWSKLDVVPLGKLDEMLMRYDLMLFELEHFATDEFGWDGFVDEYAEPTELAA